MTQRPLIFPDFPHILHGGDYNPDQWLAYPDSLADDERLMKLSGCNTFSVGIFAWTACEPDEGRYTFEWLDQVMERLARNGYKVILATPSGAKPAWMSAAYPEIRRVNRAGQREPHHGRHNHCWSSPIYREKVRQINTRLAERYKHHPALAMWHISNEYSGECLCDLCLANWRRWLQDRYHSLEAVNHAWWMYFWSHAYTAWEQIDPRETVHEGLSLDWMRFRTWQVADFLQWEMQPLRQITPAIPCTTNFMGTSPVLDYGRLADYVDIIADDQYPAYDAESPDLVRTAVGISFRNELYRTFKPERPFMLMESCPDGPQWKKPHRLKQPGLHHLEMLQALGHGAEGTCYFQWRKGRGGMEKFHGAVVDHSNSEHTRVFQTVAGLSRLYEHLSPCLGSTVDAQVGLIYDWEARWAFEFCDGPASDGAAYERVCHDHYQPFWENGVAVDILHSERDFAKYKLLIAPQLWMFKAGVAERLRAFAAGGGILVATYYTGIVDGTNLVWMGGWPGGLMDVFGLWNEETDVLGAGMTRAVMVREPNALNLRGPYAVQRVAGVVHARGAEALATYADGFCAGMPALTVHAYERGQAYYQAGQFTLEAQRDFYGALIRTLNLRRAFEGGLPPGVTAQVRHTDAQAFYFVENFTPQPQTVALGRHDYTRLSDGTALRGTLTLPPFGSEVLSRHR